MSRYVRQQLEHVHRKADLWIAHEPEALDAVLRSGVAGKIAFDAHEWYPGQRQVSLARKVWLSRLFRLAKGRVDLVFSATPGLKAKYDRVFAGGPISLMLPNASAVPGPDPDISVRDVLGLSEQIHILFFHGRLGPGRGLERLGAMAGALEPDWSVVFMGEGEIANGLAGMENVHVLPGGSHQQAINFAQGCDAGCLLYSADVENHRLGLPNKLWDFAHLSKPMVMTPLPGLMEFLDGYDVGEVVPLRYTSADLRKALDRLTSGRDYSADLARFSQDHAWSRYDDAMVEAIKAVIERPISRSNR